MSMLHKLKYIASKLEIVFAAVLFFAMLYTCGKYIDVKINGQSSLPPIPQQEKQTLLKTDAYVNKVYDDDLIEPLFIGVKNGNAQVCSTFDREARMALEKDISPVLVSLFSGTSEEVVLEDENVRNQYISALLNTEKYVLISYYGNIHASSFLPCLSQDYEITQKPMYFNVKQVFLLNDDNGFLYAIAVDEEENVYKIVPENNILFDKFSTEEYDISDGYSYFEILNDDGIHPVLTSSFITNKYEVYSLASKFGKTQDAFWIDSVFDVFGINKSFVKSYSSKNDKEVIYVEDDNEIVVGDDGSVEYKTDSMGISLEKYLGYLTDETGKYSVTDKYFAVRNLVNMLNFDNSFHRYCIAGIDYNRESDKLSVYLKSFINGVAISEEPFEALFEISGNYLDYAKFYAFKCKDLDEVTVCLNQSYVNKLFEDNDMENYLYYPILEQEDETNKYFVSWARFSEYGGEE